MIAFSPQTLTTDQVLHVLDVWPDKLVVLQGGNYRGLPFTDYLPTLEHTLQHGLTEAYLSLVDSFSLMAAPLPSTLDVLEATAGQRTPKSVKEALSPEFLPEWGAAMDREISGFLKHKCFAVESLPPGARCLPGIWIFSRKRDGAAKARFVVGGHRQIEGKDYFADQTYTAVLACRDNRILLSLAAAEGWMVAQSDIVQAFLHGVLDDATIYIRPPARYPCPPNCAMPPRTRRKPSGYYASPCATAKIRFL